MPQFDFFSFLGLVFFTLITFFFLYIYITKEVNPRLSEVTKSRAKFFSFSKKTSNTPLEVYNETFKLFL